MRQLERMISLRFKLWIVSLLLFFLPLTAEAGLITVYLDLEPQDYITAFVRIQFEDTIDMGLYERPELLDGFNLEWHAYYEDPSGWNVRSSYGPGDLFDIEQFGVSSHVTKYGNFPVISIGRLRIYDLDTRYEAADGSIWHDDMSYWEFNSIMNTGGGEWTGLLVVSECAGTYRQDVDGLFPDQLFEVPIPPTGLLLLSALLPMIGFMKRRRNSIFSSVFV